MQVQVLTLRSETRGVYAPPECCSSSAAFRIVHPHLLRSTLVTSQRQGAANQARKSDESFSDHGYGGATNAVEKACELSNPQ
eukprot:6212605-Pleurochrysis_carterae.AAC.1